MASQPKTSFLCPPIIRLVVYLLGLWGSDLAHAQSALPPTVESFLTEDCAVDRKPIALETVAQIAQSDRTLSRELSKRVTRSFDQADLGKIDQKLEEQWLRRQRALSSGAKSGLSADQTQILGQITREDYKTAGRARIVRKYQFSSAAILSKNNSPESKNAISKILQSDDKQLKAVIGAARKRSSTLTAPAGPTGGTSTLDRETGLRTATSWDGRPTKTATGPATKAGTTPTIKKINTTVPPKRIKPIHVR